MLTISGEGAMADWDVYAENYAPWDVAYDQVRTVVVEEGVTSVGHSAFAFYENITHVELPQSLESIGGCAFMGLPLLESITIPAAVASIGEEAFVASVKDGFAVAEGSEHFKAVDGVLFTADGTELVAYPGNKGGLYHVPEGTERIRCGAFTDAQVEGVALYDGMKELKAGAFQNCAAMTEMIFPVTLERIGDYAFYGCESLTTIWYDGSEEQWNEIAIGGDNECLLRATIDFRLGGEQPAVSGTVSGGAGASVAIKGEGVQVEVQEDGSFVINGSGTFDVVICKPGCLTVTVKGVTTENGDVVLPEVQMVAGDVNGDDKINISDMGAFRQEFGKVDSNIANTLTDVNGDGKVNIADMGIFRQNFGKTAEKDCTIQYA